jgi:hypothetical protein
MPKTPGSDGGGPLEGRVANAGMHTGRRGQPLSRGFANSASIPRRYDAPGSIADGWVIVEHGRNQRSSAVSTERVPHTRNPGDNVETDFASDDKRPEVDGG